MWVAADVLEEPGVVVAGVEVLVGDPRDRQTVETGARMEAEEEETVAAAAALRGAVEEARAVVHR